MHNDPTTCRIALLYLARPSVLLLLYTPTLFSVHHAARLTIICKAKSERKFYSLCCTYLHLILLEISTLLFPTLTACATDSVLRQFSLLSCQLLVLTGHPLTRKYRDAEGNVS